MYADFLQPHLSPSTHLLDVGCGSGELSLDLAATVGHVTGVDVEQEEIDAARRAMAQGAIENADFQVGDIYSLDLPDDHVDAVLAHSVLEALDRPTAALAEMKRVLRPGGVMAAASVEYTGLVIAGPQHDLTHRFYSIRERLWKIDGANPYLGRELRGLFLGVGFVDVVATTKYISYGTGGKSYENSGADVLRTAKTIGTRRRRFGTNLPPARTCRTCVEPGSSGRNRPPPTQHSHGAARSAGSHEDRCLRHIAATGPAP